MKCALTPTHQLLKYKPENLRPSHKCKDVSTHKPVTLPFYKFYACVVKPITTFPFLDPRLF